MLFTWCMLTGFIFLFTPQSITNKFQFAFARIFRWPLSIGRNISLSTRAQQPMTNVISRSEYNRLQNHLANITEQWQQERLKVEKLSGLRNRFPLEGVKLVLADVITASVSASHSELIINRGQDDGLAKGQFVLGDNSVIGVVDSVDSGTGRIRLITDSASKIEVQIAGTNRILQGVGRNSARVEMLSTEYKVKVGDRLFARKKPGFLDVAMITGRVSRCKVDEQHPLLWDITVEPACELEALDNVAVIIMNPSR